MSGKLSLEDKNKYRVALLFLGHHIRDISSDVETRKHGTDFLARFRSSEGVLSREVSCENKFEQYASGRQTFELVSVDRSRAGIVPGWVYTSRAGWLFSWFPSGELVVLQMDEARELVFSNPCRHLATTAYNKGYLSWNSLQRLGWIVSAAKSARWLDLTQELGELRTKPPMLGPQYAVKQVDACDLVGMLMSGPSSSTPVPVTQDELCEQIRRLAPLDLMKNAQANSMLRSELSCLQGLDSAVRYVASAGGRPPQSLQ